MSDGRGRPEHNDDFKINNKPHSLALEGTDLVTADAPPPEWLSKVAQDEWRALLPLLIAQGIARIDLTLVATYCDLYGHYREATDMVREEGMVLTNRLGNKAPHPAVKIVKQLADSLAKIGNTLGISASARSRIKVPPKPSAEKDALTDFLGGAA